MFATLIIGWFSRPLLMILSLSALCPSACEPHLHLTPLESMPCTRPITSNYSAPVSLLVGLSLLSACKIWKFKGTSSK